MDLGLVGSGLVLGSYVVDIKGLGFGHGIPVAGVGHDGRAGCGRIVTEPYGVSEFVDEYALNEVGQVGCVGADGGCIEFNAEAYDLTAGYGGVVDTIRCVIEVSCGDGVGGVAGFGELNFGTGIVPVGKGGVHRGLPGRGVIIRSNRDGGAGITVVQKGCRIDGTAEHGYRREQHDAHQ